VRVCVMCSSVWYVCVCVCVCVCVFKTMDKFQCATDYDVTFADIKAPVGRPRN